MAMAQQAQPKNRSQPPSKGPKLKYAHTDNTKYGMGDYYGVAIKNKLGKIRKGWGTNQVSPASLKIPPKALA